MKYTHFLFDWDGSLADSLPVWFEAYQKVFAEYGKKLTYKQIGEKVIGDWEGPSRMGIEDQVGFFIEMEKELLPKLPFLELNPGAREVIERIKRQGGRVAVVSNSKTKYVEPAMYKHDLVNLVDVLLTKEDVKFYKPDPMMINRALGMLSGERRKSLMVGDTGKDVQAAKNAGIDSALYYPRRYEEFYARRLQVGFRPTYMVRGLADLNRFLK